MRLISMLDQPDRVALARLIVDAVISETVGFAETAAPEYKTNCVSELPLTFVYGCRMLVALDDEGTAVALGILEPGRSKQTLVDILDLELTRSKNRRPDQRLLV